jgi:enoyl reductase-like protein
MITNIIGLAKVRSFWRWGIIMCKTVPLDFVHCLNHKITMSWKLDSAFQLKKKREEKARESICLGSLAELAVDLEVVLV